MANSISFSDWLNIDHLAAILFENETQIEIFCENLLRENPSWYKGKYDSLNSCWLTFGSNICIFNNGGYCSFNRAKSLGFLIFNFHDIVFNYNSLLIKWSQE